MGSIWQQPPRSDRRWLWRWGLAWLGALAIAIAIACVVTSAVVLGINA